MFRSPNAWDWIARRRRDWVRDLDLIINSSGLTDFNPDLRDALAVNVDSTRHLIEFIRGSDHAALAPPVNLLCRRAARRAGERAGAYELHAGST
jgi:hypothetical protein